MFASICVSITAMHRAQFEPSWQGSPLHAAPARPPWHARLCGARLAVHVQPTSSMLHRTSAARFPGCALRALPCAPGHEQTGRGAAPPQSMTPSSVNARRMRAAFALVAQYLRVYSPLLASTCGQALRASGHATQPACLALCPAHAGLCMECSLWRGQFAIGCKRRALHGTAGLATGCAGAAGLRRVCGDVQLARHTAGVIAQPSTSCQAFWR